MFRVKSYIPIALLLCLGFISLHPEHDHSTGICNRTQSFPRLVPCWFGIQRVSGSSTIWMSWCQIPGAVQTQQGQGACYLGIKYEVPWTTRRSSQSILKKVSPDYSLEGLNAEAEAPVLWPPDAKSWLIGKEPDAGKDWRQEEKGTTEDEMVGWYHQVHPYRLHHFLKMASQGLHPGGAFCLHTPVGFLP